MNAMRPALPLLPILLLAGCAGTGSPPRSANPPGLPAPGAELASWNRDPGEVRALMALDSSAVSDRETAEVLARFPAPRVILFNGVVAPVRMDRMARFFIAMGYPKSSFTDPATGRMSHPSGDGAIEWAGALPWYFEREGLRPVLIGHSQGGMIVSKILHEGAGTFGSDLRIWNPEAGKFEDRRDFRHPWTGAVEDIAGYRTPFAASIATGKMMRVVLGQWNMLEHLRVVPDSVESFSGFSVEGDFIGGSGHVYRAQGRAVVRNHVLARGAGHVALPALTWDPGDPRSILAGVLWDELKRNWCSELQASYK